MGRRQGFASRLAGFVGVLCSALFMHLPAYADGAASFSFRLTGEPETLDWNKASGNVETNLLTNLMEGLVGFDSKMNIIPKLARSWEVSRDGRVYTFHLRSGVQWSDGVPLRAQDFVFSWKRLLSPLTGAPYAYLLQDIQGAEAYRQGKNPDFASVGVRALNDSTLQVKLERPVAHWLNIPTFWVTFPMRKDVVEKSESTWARPGQIVTLGPYLWESYDIDSKLVFRANPRYWGQRGNVQEVVARIVRDDAEALRLYEAGKLDYLAGLTSVDSERFRTRRDFRSFPALKTAYLGFSAKQYPVSDVHVRRAVAQAIDRQGLRKILAEGHRPSDSFVPPGVPGFDPQGGLPYDPVAARKELRLAGLDPARPLQLDLLVLGWEKQILIGQFVQNELKRNLGWDVSLSVFDRKNFRAQMEMGGRPLFIGMWAADYPDPENFFSIFLKDSGNNRSRWGDARYDQWVNLARSSKISAVRKRAYQKAHELLLRDEAVLVPLYHEANLGLVRDRVRGLRVNPLSVLEIREIQLVGP